MRSDRLLLAVLAAFFIGACAEPTAPGSTESPPEGDLTTTDTDLTVDEAAVYIVQYDEATSGGDELAAAIMATGAGARALQELPFVGALATEAQIQEIGAMPGVVRVTVDAELQWHGGGAAALPSLLALLERSVPTIQGEEAREKYGVDGSGVGVAILDSGIDGLYQQDVRFPERTVQNLKILVDQEDVFCLEDQPCLRSIYVEDLANSETTVGHGTHVGGIAGGDGTMSDGFYTGVAPGANLIGIGAGDILFIFWTLAGFDYILQTADIYDIKVVNNSWGSQGDFDPGHPINVATERVAERGIAVVFSAGNCGTGAPDPRIPFVDCRPEGENQVNHYAQAPWTIGVAAACSAGHQAAMDSNCSGGRLADFSSRGLPGDPSTWPDLTAPGVWVVSARASTGSVINALDLNRDLNLCEIPDEYLPFYTCASGTSMAAPHVAGVVALMQERAGGKLTPDEVKKILTQSADPMDEFEGYEVGAGMLNALKAVARSRR